MDVRKPAVLGVCALVLVLTACAEPKTPDSVSSGQGGLSGKPCTQAVKNEYLVQWETGEIEKVVGGDVEDFKKNFIAPNLEKIKRVEYNQVFQLGENFEQEATSGPEWGQQMIKVADVWAQGVTGQGVVVGVVDTEVDESHPQLSTQFKVNTGEIRNNGIDDDRNGYVDDYYGYGYYVDDIFSDEIAYHGSHVAGIIAADHSKGSVRGVAYGSKIVEAPFLNNVGSGALDNALKALAYVQKRGVRIVNASWGSLGCGGSQILSGKINELGNAGILFVAAAGNRGVNLDQDPESPAVLNAFNQLTVGWSTYLDFLSGGSNYSFNLVHLAAPGGNIYSTVPYSVNATGATYLSGTSMAAPIVSATAALLWSAKPHAQLSQIKQAILNSVDQGQFPVITRGRLNAMKALEEIRRLVP
jgi:subtilisin family serine protease